ncbi:MAG: hypothetical protein IKY23_03300 [Lachnospiraceae bacterium]|nr:hypothetical protein [Lachnospiraceae bacterium]
MIINSKLSDEALLKAIYQATSAYSNLIGNSYLIIGKNKNSNYFYFQNFFEKKHLMHLLGINSKTLSATEFYEKCDLYNKGKGAGIALSDCTPSRNHNRTTINEKCSCCADVLRIQDAKYMKIGLKDKISQYVNFSFGYGNEATLGFQKIRDTSFPVTLIPRSIDEFVLQKYRIIFVLEKKAEEEKFSRIIMEVKGGLFKELYSDFPDDLKKLINFEK